MIQKKIGLKGLRRDSSNGPATRVVISFLDLSETAALTYDLDLKEHKAKAKSNSTHFEWGYIGNGPDLLAEAICDEVYKGDFTKEQLKHYEAKVSNLKKGLDFEVTWDVI